MDARGRMLFAPRWVERAGWVKAQQSSADYLLVLAPLGAVSVLPWTPSGEEVEARFAQLAAQPEPDYEALRLFQDRYQRLTVGSDNRTTLGELVLLHLSILHVQEPRMIYVAVLPDRVELISIAERDRRLLRSAPALDGLP